MKTLLSKLKTITPPDDYRAKSLRLILGNPQLQKTLRTRVWESMRYSVALTFTAIMIVVAAGGFSYVNFSSASPLIIGSLNAKSIAAEASRVEAELKLAQVSYYGSAEKDVAMALREVARTAPDHLNDAVLEEELNGLRPNAATPEEIDKLLETLSL
ncbi:MAG: hypothetical protein HYT82_02395 [Candidatus Harrisonbacteria bacterium]|nr:hypothetical protein [Candidatus Harrisonbacteria bacterium]MBI2604201.1 hypothetical protein [Candidatus Harrisonbacteria bacterium]